MGARLPWLVTLLVSATGCYTPPVEPHEPAAGYFDRKGPAVRTYHLEARVPVLVEARCRLVDQLLLDNPHFDRGAVYLRRAWSDQLPLDVRVLATTIEERQYPVWLKLDGTLLESRDYSEEELGALGLREAASAADVGSEWVGRRRRVARELLNSQLLVRWSGEASWGARMGWRGFPALDAELILEGTSRGMTGARGGVMDLDVPWDGVCGHAWRNR